jgi:hypothetical protein
MTETEKPAWGVFTTHCRHLRSKQLYMDLGFHPSGDETSDGTPCWCFVTQQIFGPDDEVATKSACISGRECFERDDF